LPIESYYKQVEPSDPGAAVIWRFMSSDKFRDFLTTGELYFCRADLFKGDEREGLPPEEFLSTLGLNPFDILERQELCNQLGSSDQFRESLYINCWQLMLDERDESSRMWDEYSPGESGVAVCSRYGLLKSALDGLPDRAYLGLVQYGGEHVDRGNLFNFAFTKRRQYEDEREVRALLWIMDPQEGCNRHIGPDNRLYSYALTRPSPERVPLGQRRKVDVAALVTEIVVTPWAAQETVEQVRALVASCGYDIRVRPSALTKYRDFLPKSTDIRV